MSNLYEDTLRDVLMLEPGQKLELGPFPSRAARERFRMGLYATVRKARQVDLKIAQDGGEYLESYPGLQILREGDDRLILTMSAEAPPRRVLGADGAVVREGSPEISAVMLEPGA